MSQPSHMTIDLSPVPSHTPSAPGIWQFFPLPEADPVHAWKEKTKSQVMNLLEDIEEKENVTLEAVRYARRLIDQFPYECTLLPDPDVSGFADKKAVYLEWMLDTDGSMVLTVEPDGTIAYVCTFGKACSKNLGAWDDRIVDLMRPCFVRLVQLQEKDLPAWDDASKTILLSLDLQLNVIKWDRR